MFAGQESLGAIQKLHFFNDKELPKGNISERFVSQFLELSCNPKGNSAYKLFSTMQEENKFVTGNAVCVTVTPAQEFLLQLLNHANAENYLLSLQAVLELATYSVDPDLINQTASYEVNLIAKAVNKLHLEHLTPPKKVA